MTKSADYKEEARIHLRQASEYKETGSLKQALKECDFAIKIDPDLPDAHNLRGVILEGLGKRKDAIRSYKRAIELNPNFVPARENFKRLDPKGRISFDLVTVATFSYPLEANLAKAQLESEGIFSFVADEHMASMNWLYSNSTGGVRLQVSKADAETARQILDHTPTAEELSDDALIDSEDTPKCPKCGADNVHYETFDSQAVFASQLVIIPIGAMGIPLSFISKNWKCDKCGFRWKWEEPSDEIESSD